MGSSNKFVIGVGPDYHNIPFGHCSANEIDLKFQYRYANQYPKAIRDSSFLLLAFNVMLTRIIRP